MLKSNLLDAGGRLSPDLDQLGSVISGEPGENQDQGQGAAEGDPDHHVTQAPGHHGPQVPAVSRPRVPTEMIRQTSGAPTLAKTQSRVPEMICS